jgi:hypothetical protein
MLYSRSIVTHSLFVDIEEGHITTRSIRNCNEVRSISHRRWCKNGIGIVKVGCAQDSVVKANEGEGKMWTILVYYM